MSIGILTYLGSHQKKDGIPRRVAVATEDRYLLDLLIRYYCLQAGRGARVIRWSKKEDAQIRAEIEEAPLFEQKPLHLVLGAPRGWVKSTQPARSVAVTSQEAEGVLIGEQFAYRDRALVLRALTRILGLQWRIGELARVDWTWAQSWEDFEPTLIRAKLLSWGLDDLHRFVEVRVRADIFALIRDRDWWSIHWLAERYGRPWLYRHLMEFTVQVARIHQLRARGIKAASAGRHLGLPEWQLRYVLESSEETTLETLVEFAKRIVKLDPLVDRDPRGGLDVLLMGAKV